MSEGLSCSFASLCKSNCDSSSRYPGYNKYFPLLSCDKEVKSHLRNVKVSQASVSSEKDLILARAGLFDEAGDDLTICPKHRSKMGLFWRPSRKCQHPLHCNRNNKPERGANLQISKEIMLKWKVLVPIGAGIIYNTTVMSTCLVTESQTCSNQGLHL